MRMKRGMPWYLTSRVHGQSSAILDKQFKYKQSRKAQSTQKSCQSKQTKIFFLHLKQQTEFVFNN